MSTQLAVFDGLQLPVEFNAELFANAQSLLGGLGGASINKMSIRGTVFRLNKAGQELVIEQPHVDVAVIGASPHVGRKYYAGAYNPESKDGPTCFSKDGVSPSEKSSVKQSAKCATCPQNQLGSGKPVGTKQTRACTFSKRIIVTAHGDEGGDAYALDVNALSLFGEGKKEQNKFTLSEYGKVLATPRPGYPNGVPPIAMVTRMSFDRDSSVPKLFFTPVGFLALDVISKALARSKEQDVVAMLDDVVSSSEPDEVPTQATIAAAAVSVPPVVAAPVAAPVAPTPAPAPPPPAPVAAPKATGFGTAKAATPAAPAPQPAPAVIPAAPVAAPVAAPAPSANAQSLAAQLANFDD